jgi:PPM family protein phosphatase
MENIIFERISPNPGYAVEARSCIGGRCEQQDRAYLRCEAQRVFALVCDGMGGGADGGLASETAVASMRQSYKEARDTADDPASFLYRAMLAADHAVSKALQAQAGGTTAVAALICGKLLYWLSVGDSRLYILRSGELLPVTRDHNYSLRLNALWDRGEISAELYKKEARRGDALISYLGLGGISLFDLTQEGFPLSRGDKLLLATDGIFKILPADSIKRVIGSGLTLPARADALIQEISLQSEEQAQDNATFILIDVL